MIKDHTRFVIYKQSDINKPYVDINSNDTKANISDVCTGSVFSKTVPPI